MNIDLNTTLILTSKITAINLMVTSLEYLNIREVTTESGIWKWSLLKEEMHTFPKAIVNFYEFIFSEKVFAYLLVLRFIFSFNLLFAQNLFNIGFLFLSTVLISQRFRGAYNGGSDYMTILTLGALTIGKSTNKHPNVLKGVFIYIALQVTLSYFFAGIVKIKNKEWRNGRALVELSNSSNYSPPKILKDIFSNKQISFYSGWIIIIAEILFPLIFLTKHFEVFILIAFIFHLFNFFFFGLNRFVWAWMATYPALIYAIKFI